MYKKMIFPIAICIAGIVIVAGIAIAIATCHEPYFDEKILAYCETNDELTLSEVTSFDWDIAYFDYQSYMQGEGIKEKYGLSGELTELIVDHNYRIAFYKDSELVSDEILTWTEIEFERSVETIKPDTLFTVEWTSRSYNSRVLSLKLKNREDCRPQ